MSEDVRAAAERLIEDAERHWRDYDREEQFAVDILTVAQVALEAADRQAALAAELERLRAALTDVMRRAVKARGYALRSDAIPASNGLYYIADICRVALDTTPAVAPGASDATPSLSCDACGDPITEDYIETLVEGDTGEYHVACAPPGMPRRTVLVAPGASDAGEGSDDDPSEKLP
jgi:hypothetical protein